MSGRKMDGDGWWHGKIGDNEVVLRLSARTEGEPLFLSGQSTMDVSLEELRLYVLAMGGTEKTRTMLLPSPGARSGSNRYWMDQLKDELKRAFRIAELDGQFVDGAFSNIGMPSDFRGAMWEISDHCDSAIKASRKKSRSAKSVARMDLLREVSAACVALSYFTRAGDWTLFYHLGEVIVTLIDRAIENCKAPSYDGLA